MARLIFIILLFSFCTTSSSGQSFNDPKVDSFISRKLDIVRFFVRRDYKPEHRLPYFDTMTVGNEKLYLDTVSVPAIEYLQRVTGIRTRMTMEYTRRYHLNRKIVAKWDRWLRKYGDALIWSDKLNEPVL